MRREDLRKKHSIQSDQLSNWQRDIQVEAVLVKMLIGNIMIKVQTPLVGHFLSYVFSSIFKMCFIDFLREGRKGREREKKHGCERETTTPLPPA